MREVIGRLAFLAVVAASLPAPAGATEPVPSHYQALVDQLKQTENDRKGKGALIDFRAIRYAYADSLDYDPYGTLVELHRVEMLHAYEHRDMQVALHEAQRVLERNYTDIGAHVIAELALTELHQPDLARFHRMIARELLLSIFRTGEGTSPATAYQIVAVPEEYAVLNARNVAFQNQTYEVIGGHHYDKIVVSDPVHGVSTLWFNVDRMMDWANHMFSPQFRHLPAHGGPPDAGLAAATSMLSQSP